MPNPPDKFTAFAVTSEMTIEDYANALTTAWADGYTGPFIPIPSPLADGSTWVGCGGYGE